MFFVTVFVICIQKLQSIIPSIINKDKATIQYCTYFFSLVSQNVYLRVTVVLLSLFDESSLLMEKCVLYVYLKLFWQRKTNACSFKSYDYHYYFWRLKILTSALSVSLKLRFSYKNVCPIKFGINLVM